MPRLLRSPVLTLAAGAALAGCANAGEDLGFGVPRGTPVAAVVYLDRDASGTITAVDTSITGIIVHLVVAGTQDTVATASSDSSGLVTFPTVAVGQYSVLVDTTTLGDSLATTLLPARVAVIAGGPPPLIQAALAFPVLTIAEVRGATAGRRVATGGVVLAGRQMFSDTSAHIADTTGALRLLAVTNLSGGNVSFPGEQVRVTGVVAVRQGQVVLDQVKLSLLGNAGPPAVDTLSTLQAAGAVAGASDAALVFITDAEITDTATAGAGLQVTVDDGTGPLQVELDSLITFPLANFVPGDSLDATGVLVPLGGGTWKLKPRTGGDVTVF